MQGKNEQYDKKNNNKWKTYLHDMRKHLWVMQSLVEMALQGSLRSMLWQRVPC